MSHQAVEQSWYFQLGGLEESCAFFPSARVFKSSERRPQSIRLGKLPVKRKNKPYVLRLVDVDLACQYARGVSASAKSRDLRLCIHAGRLQNLASSGAKQMRRPKQSLLLMVG